MTIRKRIEEANTLAENGFVEAALILTLVAIAAGARNAYPKEKDGKSFALYADERICHSVFKLRSSVRSFVGFPYGDEKRTIGEALYKEFRCNLIHEAKLPCQVRFDENDPSVSLECHGDILVIGKGWLNLLWDGLRRDPLLAEEFQEQHIPDPPELSFIGEGLQDDFDKNGVKKYLCTSGRWAVLKLFLRFVGTERLRYMSDDEIREFWDHEVMSSPERYGVNGGGITGLARFPSSQSVSFHKCNCDNGSSSYQITEHGISMFRYLLRGYKN